MTFCLLCDEEQVHSECFNEHKLPTHGAKDGNGESCDQCDDIFENMPDLRKHIETKHKPEPEETVTNEVTLEEDPEEYNLEEDANELVDGQSTESETIVTNKVNLEQDPEEVNLEDDTKESADVYSKESIHMIAKSLVNDILTNLEEQVVSDIPFESNRTKGPRSDDSSGIANNSRNSDLDDEESETETVNEDDCSPATGGEDYVPTEIVVVRGNEVEVSKTKEVIKENEYEMLRQRLAELQEERLTQDIRTIKLEDEKHTLKETINNGFQQYDALLKEFEKTKKERKNDKKDYERKISAMTELERVSKELDTKLKEAMKVTSDVKKTLEKSEKDKVKAGKQLKQR